MCRSEEACHCPVGGGGRGEGGEREKKGGKEGRREGGKEGRREGGKEGRREGRNQVVERGAHVPLK